MSTCGLRAGFVTWTG